MYHVRPYIYVIAYILDTLTIVKVSTAAKHSDPEIVNVHLWEYINDFSYISKESYSQNDGSNFQRISSSNATGSS